MYEILGAEAGATEVISFGEKPHTDHPDEATFMKLPQKVASGTTSTKQVESSFFRVTLTTERQLSHDNRRANEAQVCPDPGT